MNGGGVDTGTLDTGTVEAGRIEPSIRNALLYFLSLAAFPLTACAAMYGGWWLMGPVAYLIVVESLDGAFGQEERNMDPAQTSEGQLFWYEVTVLLWAIFWPVTLIFSLWQILVVGHLAVWGIVILVMGMANIGQVVFIVGHELVHRRIAWQRWLGEFLLASASYPHYATEHIYVHHALVSTPGDPGSAPKGVSFWQHIPRDLKCSLTEAWRFARQRLARRRLPVWHYTNPFWRYAFETAAWYALIYWMSGPWAVLVFAVVCLSMILSMKVINYVQHYGLQRIRLLNGRYEKVLPRHSWTASSRFTNWIFYNMQRHADHHMEANRHYPVLQHYGKDESPKLPGNYLKMAGLALSARRWFKTMDPLVDEWRAKFYPEIKDWHVYDSRAYAGYPDAFEEIGKILDTAPLLAEWINHSPELLENLQDREFTDLDLPEGFGPDSDYERVARSGLARLYWTREFSVSEMRERIAEIPIQGTREAVEAARHWSNDKTFQIGVHMMRGSLSPVEAGIALSNVAEAAIASLLSAVDKAFASRHIRQAGDGVAMAVLGDLASREAMPGTELRTVIVYETSGSSEMHNEVICSRYHEALHSLSHGSLLFESASNLEQGKTIYSLADFIKHYQTAGSTEEMLDLTRARCIFVSGDPEIGERFDEARHEILTQGTARDALISELHGITAGTAGSDLQSIEDMRGGRQDVERAARFLQLTHASETPDILAPDAISVFQTAGANGLISSEAAMRLAEAAKMWQNLRGISRLAMQDGPLNGTASPSVEEMIARSCGMDDYSELTEKIRETASRTAADIAELTT